MLGSVLSGDVSLHEARVSRIMYHGTSSYYLRSILKHGLDGNRNKGTGYAHPRQNGITYGDSISIDRSKSIVDPNTPVVDTYPGIYLTPFLQYAVEASSMMSIEGYNPLIIIVTVSQSSLRADEDDILYEIIDPKPVSLEHAYSIYTDEIDGKKEYREFKIGIYSKLNLSDADRQHIDRSLDSLWEITIRRLAMYHKEETGVNLEDLDDVEREYRSIFSRFTKLLSRLTRDSISSRYPGSIGYRGSSRILSVVEMVNAFKIVNGVRPLKLITHYGSIPGGEWGFMKNTGLGRLEKPDSV